MKNIFLKYVGVLSFLVGMPVLSSCGAQDNNKINVVATIFPEYDWVLNVVGKDNKDINTTLLLNSGVDLHSYQPTPKDIVTISNCDLFVYVGGESDEWVEDVLKEAKNKNMKTINLLETLGDKAKEEELVEGMEGEEHDHDHDHEEGEEHEHHHDDDEEEGPEYDEHVWLSVKNAEIFVNEISAKMGEIDSANKATYESNATSYVSKLKELDNKYTDAVSKKNKDTLLFADRFPFRYLVEDYSLKYYAAFIGCSAETEASFETIKFLAAKVDELNLDVILKIESSDGGIANTVKNATTNKNQEILTMDSIQSSTLEEYKKGKDYLKIMEQNLDILKQALR